MTAKHLQLKIEDTDFKPCDPSDAMWYAEAIYAAPERCPRNLRVLAFETFETEESDDGVRLKWISGAHDECGETDYNYAYYTGSDQPNPLWVVPAGQHMIEGKIEPCPGNPAWSPNEEEEV